MTALETLRVARERGLTLTVSGDKLLVFPADGVDAELRAALAACKVELLKMLPRLDKRGLPEGSCQLCGSSHWWERGGQWHCSGCEVWPDQLVRTCAIGWP
jgi:hypothetical protein